MRYLTIITLKLSLFSMLFFTSCGETKSSHSGHGHGDHEGHGDHHEEEGTHLTAEQAATIGLEFGATSALKLNDFIQANGVLTLPNNATYAVYAKTGGYLVSNEAIYKGASIKKGAVIAYIESKEIIQLQQDYLASKATLPYLQSEVDRQTKLVNSKAGVQKHLEQAQAEFDVAESITKGLAKQLSFIGINSTKVATNNIKQRIAITSPATGIITALNLSNGKFVTTDTEIATVIDQTKAILELNIFEKDIAKVQLGKTISYQVPAMGIKNYEATVISINKDFDTQQKTIGITASLNDLKPTFVKNIFVNGQIWLNDATVQALPEEAIITDGEDTFIFVGKSRADEFDFEQISVITGATDKGFQAVEFLQDLPTDYQIVTKGAYYVYAQSKVGSLAHEH